MAIDKKNVKKPEKIDDNLSKNYNINLEMIPRSYKKKSEKFTEGGITIDTSFISSLIKSKEKRTSIYNTKNLIETFNVIIKLKPISRYLTMEDNETLKFPSYKIEISELPLDYIEQVFVYDKKRNYEKLYIKNDFNLDNLRNYIYNYIVDTSKILDSKELFNRITDSIIKHLSKDNIKIVYNYFDEDDNPDTIMGNHKKSNNKILNEIIFDRDNNTMKESLIDYLD